MRRLAAFGGTFDPVHRGHTEGAKHALAVLQLDLVLFVPAGCPPHKLGEPLTPFCHRFAMLALALREEERFVVSPVEQEVEGPTFTVDTIGRLRARFPADRLFFLMGSDSFAQITTWHEWQRLPELATLVVLWRPSGHRGWGELPVPEEFRARVVQIPRSARPGAPVPEGSILFLDNDPIEASASDLRRRLRQGERPGHLMDAAVVSYARKHRLYDEQGDDGP